LNLITAITAIVLHLNTQTVDIYVGERMVATCYSTSGQHNDEVMAARVVCTPVK
jgi:hypothetical protein